MKVEKLLPEVYYRESRDFAYVGRVIGLVLNYMKTAADCVGINLDNENVDANTIELLVDTLGFEARHEYVNKDLIVVASAFSELLRKKGTAEAINLAVRLLLNSQNIKNQTDFEFCILNEEKAEIEINIPDVLTDIVLLEDLFDYILPVGITYKFTKFSNNKNTRLSTFGSQSVLVSDTDKDFANQKTSAYQGDEYLGIIATDANILSTDEQYIEDARGSIYTGLIPNQISTESTSAEDN